MFKFDLIALAIKAGSLLFGVLIFWGIWTHNVHKAVEDNTKEIADKHATAINADNSKLNNAVTKYTNTGIPNYMDTLNIPDPKVINRIPLDEVEVLTPFIPDESYEDEND